MAETDQTIQDLIAANQRQAAEIAKLSEQVTALTARVPMADEPAPAPGFAEFPKVVYRQVETPGQIDVPGNETRVVRDAAEYDAAVADGFFPTPFAADRKAAKKR